MATYDELLAGVALFHDLPRRELGWLGEVCREREYAPGDTLARQGGGCPGVTIIITGRALVSERIEDGVERELGVLEAGATFGALATLGDEPCRVSLTALKATRALVLPGWELRAALREYPEIAIHLLAAAASLLRAEATQDGTA